MSVWSDSRVIELAKSFVPATDEVWRLQRGTDPECKFFQEMADHGHYGGREGSTRQGIYICAPSGEFLASINSNNADRVLSMMQRGLEAWKKLPDAKRLLAEDSEIKPIHRWEDSYPMDGLVLNMFTRDLPEECDPEKPCSIRWNQDRVWFSKDEARGWLPENLEVGETHAVATDVTQRLVRLHLVDTVHGQSATFSTRDIKSAALEARISKIDGTRVYFTLRGTTEAESPGRGRNSTMHGVSTSLLGSGTFDLHLQRFVAFELVGVGQRWGRTTFNGRRGQLEVSPVGFAFQLASNEELRVAPAFIASYDVDWVQRPARRPFDVAAFFRRLDRNGDGQLKGDEITGRLEDRLSELDTNQDGTVSETEFTEAVSRSR